MWHGGFKQYINKHVNNDADGVETLTDSKVLWVNIILVWLSFAIFGSLVFLNIGFGLLIIVFSLINCATHIRQAIKDKRWNSGLVVASVQILISIYAAYYLTINVINYALIWWLGSIIFSIIVHILLFKIVMTKK